MNLNWFIMPSWALVIMGAWFAIIGADPVLLNSAHPELLWQLLDPLKVATVGAFVWMSGVVLQCILGIVAIDRMLRRAA